MICQNCGKEGVIVQLVTENVGKGEKLPVIEDIPLIQCQNCGESYYTAKTLHELEELLAGITDNNLQNEYDIGKAVGRESW